MVAGLGITSTQHAECCVLTVVGDLELVHARKLEVALIRHTTVSTPLVLDLTGVQFMDSVGLYVVLRTHHEYRQVGQQLVAVVSPIVLRVFELAGVQHVLPIYASVNEALGVFGVPATWPDSAPVAEP